MRNLEKKKDENKRRLSKPIGNYRQQTMHITGSDINKKRGKRGREKNMAVVATGNIWHI